MTSIDILTDPAYTTLNTYAVLAKTGIITTIGTTIISGGNYGTPGAVNITGNYTGSTGVVDGTNAATAQTELLQLRSDISINIPLGTGFNPAGGVQTFTPGRYDNIVDDTWLAGSDIILDAVGDANGQFFFIFGNDMIFNSVTSITLTNGAQAKNVFWMAGADISFTGTIPTTTIPGIFLAFTSITVANVFDDFNGRLYAGETTITFAGEGTSNIDGNINDVVCYAKGTLIMTKDGYKAIEDIKAGQHVVTKGKLRTGQKDTQLKLVKHESLLITEPVMWISKFKVNTRNDNSKPICIKKGALSDNKPFQDLFVSPGHGIVVNGQLVSAKALVNGTTIIQDSECSSVEYYHLECEDHSALLANGVLAESYLDNKNRRVFEPSSKLRRVPNHRQRQLQKFAFRKGSA
jgi:hypothetical protein